jgi:S-adenosylmethionine-diacylglycerol 3-amino-3-carboxypropyl transferase
MKSFLQSINYSSCNEDSRSEYKALDIKSDDSILCITGSGSRPLELLVKRPASIVSIDFNPCQNFMLELKMRAFESLEYDEILEFFGVSQSKDREKIYKLMRKSLSTEAMNYWDNNIAMIKRGMIYQGRWEKYFHTMAFIIGIERSDVRARLFNSANLIEQKKIWTEEWNPTFWKIFLRIISPRIIWRLFFRDPGFYKYVPGKSYIYRYIYNRFNSAIEHFLLRESPFATLLFFGKYVNPNVLPIYIQRDHFNTIRKNLKCIQIVTEPLNTYLGKLRKQQFSKFSLSDFASYLTDKEYIDCWRHILECAVNGTIICERQWLVKREVPEEFQKSIIRNSNLEDALALSDDSMFYTFNIAQKL